jgi:lysophospholipid acyltransferase (LPLAT)-like uncharacterized protein
MAKLFTLKNKRRMPKWLAFLAACLVKCWSLTYRVTIKDRYKLLEMKRDWPFVGTIWHNRLLFISPLIPREVLKRCAVLISASRDGEYISTFIKFFGMKVVRGSSSRGGFRAFLDLRSSLRDGFTTVLTLDGPRGPKYEPHLGAVVLAQQTRCPLVPISVNAKRRWNLKSWDRMQIPYPFSKVEIVIGKPIHVKSFQDPEKVLTTLKREMMRLTDDI